MRKSLVVALATVLLGVIGTAAQAATTSVNGTGSYDKLVVKNGNSSLVFKIHAPGGACDIKYVTVKFRDRDGTRYAIDGGCYPGAVWGTSLTRGDTLVECDDFRLTYSAAKQAWTGTVPRSCLKRLGGAVKVTDSYVDDYTPTINQVSGTKYVAKG